MCQETGSDHGSMIIKHVNLSKLRVAVCGGCSMSRSRVSVDLKHAVTQKLISWSMVDGMSEKQQNHQLETG